MSVAGQDQPARCAGGQGALTVSVMCSSWLLAFRVGSQSGSKRVDVQRHKHAKVRTFTAIRQPERIHSCIGDGSTGRVSMTVAKSTTIWYRRDYERRTEYLGAGKNEPEGAHGKMFCFQSISWISTDIKNVAQHKAANHEGNMLIPNACNCLGLLDRAWLSCAHQSMRTVIAR